MNRDEHSKDILLSRLFGTLEALEDKNEYCEPQMFFSIMEKVVIQYQEKNGEVSGATATRRK